MKAKRSLALLLAALLALGLLVPLWGGVRRLSEARQGPQVVFSPYSLSGLDCLKNEETGEEWSLFPYAHRNGTCELPMEVGEPLKYSINMVRYLFRVESETLEVERIELYAQDHWHRLYQEDGCLYTQRADGLWPFLGRRKVCVLSEEAGFYAPIKLAGLEGCGVFLTSAEDPGNQGEITVYTPTGKGWKQATFVLPDGTETTSISGSVRRHRDEETLGYSIAPTTGQMELRLAGEEGIYQVNYTEGKLLLLPEEGAGTEWTY